MEILAVGIAGSVFDGVRAAIKAACAPGSWRAVNHLTPELAAQARQGSLRVITTFDPPTAADYRNTAAALYAMAELHGLPNVIQADASSDPNALLADCGLPAGDLPGFPTSGPGCEWLLPAQQFARTGQRVPQVWPREWLLDGDNPDQPLPRIIPLAGPARTLAYGPYVGFSPGPARLSVVLAVSPHCRHAEMAIELHGSAQLGRGWFVLTQPGIFAAEIDVVIPSAREALEIRLKSERGAIEGEIGVDQVVLRPV